MSETDPPGESENWERKVIEKLARSALDEQRKSRNWGIVFKSLTFIYLFALLFVAFGWLGGREPMPGDHTVVSRVTDVTGKVQPTADELASKRSFLETNSQVPRKLKIAARG